MMEPGLRHPSRRVVRGLTALLLAVLPPALAAQQSPDPHEIVLPASLHWTGGNGLELATVYGDPNREGSRYAVMLRLQPGRWIQPHWHPHDKDLVVISGQLLMGMGSTIDTTHLRTIPAGGHASVPATTRHYEGAAEPTMVMLYGIGPLVTYPAALSDSAARTRAGLPKGAPSAAALRAAYLEAYNHGDAESMGEFYTDSAVRMPYGATAEVGRVAIVAGYRASFAARTWTPALSFVVADTESVGAKLIERGTYHEEMVPRSGGTRFHEDGKYVAVMERGSDGRWRYAWSIFNRDT